MKQDLYFASWIAAILGLAMSPWYLGRNGASALVVGALFGYVVWPVVSAYVQREQQRMAEADLDWNEYVRQSGENRKWEA